MCPDCLSDDIRIEEYDFGMDWETGYRDSGEYFVCRGCGSRGNPDELLDPAKYAPIKKFSIGE